MADLIDRTALLEKRVPKEKTSDLVCQMIPLKDVQEAPAVDAVEVVRCYECKQSERMSSPYGTVVHCHRWGKDVDYDGFCHEGY